jgi:hypothetical protein
MAQGEGAFWPVSSEPLLEGFGRIMAPVPVAISLSLRQKVFSKTGCAVFPAGIICRIN